MLPLFGMIDIMPILEMSKPKSTSDLPRSQIKEAARPGWEPRSEACG